MGDEGNSYWGPRDVLGWDGVGAKSEAPKIEHTLDGFDTNIHTHIR